MVYDLDALVSDAKSYALSNGIVQKDGEYTVDDAVVASKFAERMKKDPRFRNTQSQKYADGLKSEKERMISVWNNAVILENVLKNHPELRVNYRMFDQTINAIDEADREKSDYYKYWQEETEKTGKAYRQQDLARTLEAAAEIDKNAERVVHAHRAVMMPLTKLFGKRFKIVADRKLHLRYSL